MQGTDQNIMNLIKEVAEELQQSEITLAQGEKQQRTRENYLAQANASYEKADQAVKLGVRILEEAQQTLSTLQGECKISVKLLKQLIIILFNFLL